MVVPHNGIYHHITFFLTPPEKGGSFSDHSSTMDDTKFIVEIQKYTEIYNPQNKHYEDIRKKKRINEIYN